MKRLFAFAAVSASLFICTPMFAHHGSAVYDTSKTLTVTGVVMEYIWSNPHVFLKVDAKDESGKTVHWIVEAQNPVSMHEIGWTKNTFKPGDEVSVDVNPARNGSAVGSTGGSGPTVHHHRIVINGKQFQ